MKLGVVLPNWIGDVAMATPTLRALATHFAPHGVSLVGVMRPYVAGVLEGTPWLAERLYYDPRAKDRRLSASAVLRQLRQRRLDCLVILPNSLRSGFIGWLSGARRRVGYARNARGWMLTDKLDAPRQGRRLKPVSAVDYYLETARHLGCAIASRQLELATTDADRQATDAVWRRLGLAVGDQVVSLCPAGAFGSAKHWPEEHFAQLARRLVEQLGCRVLIVCGPAERAAAGRIQQAAAHRHVVSLAAETPSIGLTKECLRRSRLVVSTDSGPRHLAAGFGVPTVALFGATDPRWSLNYNPREIHLYESLPCGPCARRVCPLKHHRCMRDLDPQRVLAAAQSLWRRGPGTKAA